MKLYKNKRIGKVIIIAEGARHEFSLAKKIFVDVLGYTQIEKRRNCARFYIRKKDPHSVVAVVNARTSNIASINENEYLDEIFEGLIEQYGFDIDNAAIYYLFDRDPESNKDTRLITNLIAKLQNSRENYDNLRGGMMILSYPSIEAYEISHFVDESFQLKMRLGSEAKKYINQNSSAVSINKISGESIVHAAVEMRRFLEEREIDIDFDNFSDINSAVFMREESYLHEEGSFRLLSMFSCVLMDLGVLLEY